MNEKFSSSITVYIIRVYLALLIATALKNKKFNLKLLVHVVFQFAANLESSKFNFYLTETNPCIYYAYLKGKN